MLFKRKSSSSRPKALQRLSLYFFNRPRRTAILCTAIVLFGVLSYSTLLKREGFPSIETPFALSQGTYLVNDAAKVDNEAAKPLSEFLLKQSGVNSVQTQAFDNFFVAQVSYDENVNAEAKSNELNQQIKDQKVLPEQAVNSLEAFKFGFTPRGDELVVSFYSKQNVDTDILIAKAQEASEFFETKRLSTVESVSIINPYETARNPLTGQEEIAQKSFERFGKRENDTNNFYKAVVIGFMQKDSADNLQMDAEVKSAVDDLNRSSMFAGYTAEISASNAPQINAQIDELQRTLLEGLLAVLIVGSLVIAIRASVITVLSMVTVIAIVNGILYLTGYSLNTITLFGLILGLSLIVDDTIIMVEALDSQRRRRRSPDVAVSEATRKVSRAMIAATSTAILSFAPLLFVGGILGSFIRAIPITIIAALATSLVVALVFIPLFARFLLLKQKPKTGKHAPEFDAASIEERFAKVLAKPMLWAKNSKAKLVGVCLVALVIGFGFIGAGGFLFQKVTFNIFPSTKDTNQLSVTINFQPGTTIETAQSVAADAEKIVDRVTGDNFVKAAYFGQADVKSAILNIELKDYKDREVTAPQLVDKMKAEYQNFGQANVAVAQIDAGPPASAFAAQVDASQNRDAANRLANDIASYLQTARLERIDGSVAEIEAVSKPNPSIFTRDDNKAYLSVEARFKDTDTTTLVTLAQTAVEKEFTKERVARYGLNENALSFNFGQESENQDSFKTLALAFPALLAVIYLLLALQFKSLLQPLLIFMAIPFSLFGITLGLYLTDNAFSFFAMLGFFALIGLSIKNTILLTDYANQAQQDGLHPVDAMHEALGQRFRPLIATSLTAVVSLIPLALTSPFWEGLAVVLIFGLLSSTFLVVTVFPYYYLAAEFVRRHVNRRTGLLWIVLTAACAALLIVALPKASDSIEISPALIPIFILIGAIASAVGIKTFRKFRTRRNVA